VSRTDRATALALARKYRDASAAARAFSTASTHARITLQHLGLTDDHAILFDRLASRVFGTDASCTSPNDIARNIFGQSNLWGYGISGDLPMVLVHVADTSAISLVRQLLYAQEYWRVKDLRADLIIVNDHPADYLDEVQQQLAALIREPRWSGWLERPGGIFLLRSDGMPQADCHLLSAGRADRVARGSRRSGATARSQSAVAFARRSGAVVEYVAAAKTRAHTDRGRPATDGKRHRRIRAGRA
jgi:cyclic beta-1,2-glucan synthetase